MWACKFFFRDLSKGQEGCPRSSNEQLLQLGHNSLYEREILISN